MSKGLRSVAAAAVSAAFMFTAAVPVQAQDYPTRPVTILVPQAPGASSDLIARTLGERLQALWGQSVVIDNRPGAGSNLGAAVAARAAPDGYTLMIGTDALRPMSTGVCKSSPVVRSSACKKYFGAPVVGPVLATT